MSQPTRGVGERVGTAPARLRLAALWLAACRKLLGAHPSTAKALAELASANERLGHFDAALADLEEALAMVTAVRGDEDRELLPILNRIDRVCLRLGRPKDAWKYSERALKIATRTFGHDSVELAKPLAALAEAYFALGLIDKCYVAVTRELLIARAAFGEDDPQTAKARVRLGVVLAELGDLAQAKALHQRALAVMRAHGREDWTAAILVSLAAAHVAGGENAAARPLYEEALATARAHFGDRHATTGAYLATLARHLGRIGEDQAALAMYDQALAIMRAALGATHPEVATALLDKGRLQWRTNPAAGRADVLRAVAILGSQAHRPRLFAQAHLLIARMLEPSPAAILFRKLAINEIESIRLHVARLDPILERNFLRQNEDEFRALGDILVCQGRLPEAQQVLTMIKERELFGLTRIDARNTKVALTPLEAQWLEHGETLLAEIKTDVARMEARSWRAAIRDRSLRPSGIPDFASLHPGYEGVLDAAAKRLGAWLDELVAAFDAAETKSDKGAPSAALAASAPAPGTALLQYLFAPDHRSLSIILTTGDLQREQRVPLPDGELNRLVFAMREAVQNRSADCLASAQRLYRLLIAPVAVDLHARHIHTLALSLDGALRYLPVAALHDGERYLIEQFALVLTTAAAHAPASRPATPRAVGLGVSRPVAGCQPLPGVREELAAVISTDGGRSGVLPGVIRLDEAFTADELYRATAQANSVVHVASHFVFEAAHEASSYLVLGDGSRLTLAELAELRFTDVELVVLSACNTAIGGGHRQSGREIEGLGALVRHQGGRRVLATLWPVADRATATLMRGFYRNQFEAALTAPEALRRAQLALIDDRSASRGELVMRSLIDPADEPADGGTYAGTSHPFYWAPYILMGETADDRSDRFGTIS
jgi:CHAT domain-containing protein/tetratricopeptide (TPR) repeat protein